MTITLETVENLAPDQKSLTAAKKLLKPAKWVLKQSHENLIWAHCQGSGANPYMTVIDTNDHGYKCTCPSRKFPCKHALALMWMVADSDDVASEYPPADMPDWVKDWLGRRRPATDTADSTKETKKSHGKSIEKSILTADEPTKPIDPEAEKKKQQAAAKRALKTKQATDKAITQGVIDYEQWLNDQLRTGLGSFLDNASDRCRKIASRLVDAKATTLASRLDELPAKLLHAHTDMRLRVATNELSKTIWLIKAWQKNPENIEVRRAINMVESRNKLLEKTDNLKVTGIWQVVAEHIDTRKDGLISHATWLRLIKEEGNHDTDNQTPSFAVLQDYYPVSNGRQSLVSRMGDMLHATVVFYSHHYPLRGVLTEQQAMSLDDLPLVEQHKITQDLQQDNRTDKLAFFKQYQHALSHVPWLDAMPFMLPKGRLVANISQKNKHAKSKKSEPLQNIWWQSSADNEQDKWQLPFLPHQHLEDSQWALLLASDAKETMILWDGVYAKLGSSATDWGVL